ncbi:unnamed protein product [Amaranthus hypochondriacus]
MMILRDKEESSYNTKQEVGGEQSTKQSTQASTSTSTKQWSSGFKNPRIVRVSRTFGGKDRHSKVCTIKGLRDRRIRLSVPTAIQLYDLQDRLGLNQPSKVVDWLLDSTKNDIDKLPPLPIIPGTFTSQGYGSLPFHASSSQYFDTSLLSSRKNDQPNIPLENRGWVRKNVGININSSNQDDLDSVVDEDDESIVGKLKYWDPNGIMRSKQKEVGHDQGGSSQVLAQNLFPISSNTNNSSMLPSQNSNPSFMGNNPMLNYYHLEPSNLSLSQLGSLGLVHSNSHRDNHTQTSLGLTQPSSLSLSSMSQLYLCPSMPTSSYFPHNQHDHHHHHHHIGSFMNNNNSNPFSSSFHSSSGMEMKPFPLSMNHNPHLQQSDEEDHHRKSNHSVWKESSRN